MGTVASKNHPLIRTADLDIEVRASDSGKLTMVGHAARFNEDTTINSWEGRFVERIAPGAFAKTIREKTPVLQFDHGRDPAVGALPIGSIDELREDSKGLYVEATLHDNDHARPVRDAIASGALSGMSFQFRVLRDDWDETGDIPVRTVNEVELFELGPVVFPAYPTTDVGMRSLVDNLSPDLAAEMIGLLQARVDAASSGTSTRNPDAASSGTSVNLNELTARVRLHLADIA